MHPLAFEALLEWVLDEFWLYKSIFGIHQDQFFKVEQPAQVRLFGENCELPFGPAAGPHTQLAQNIVTAYLCGARYFELKTVQVLDELEIAKPCIEAHDEGYNTEWSTELTVPEAYDEYLKAWLILHLLKRLLGLSANPECGFIFNMSVGYDLAGLQSVKIDQFIGHLKDASQNTDFQRYLKRLQEIPANPKYGSILKLRRDWNVLIQTISPQISTSITLSTMHGCPPGEIEAICKYLLAEKRLHTLVKLNPTLLGYDVVREIFDRLDYSYIEINENAFSKDLRFADAVPMLKELQVFAESQKMHFGVKLSNTLPVVNHKGILPGEEMYLSGRALFPLTIHLAARLAETFAGKLHISYSGGASYSNIQALYQTGIYPITLATELLKPGGYLRLNQLALALSGASLPLAGIDVKSLHCIAVESLKSTALYKKAVSADNHKIKRVLPRFDCALAPCVQNCPLGQEIPEYIRLIGRKQFRAALRKILEHNPLPHITGYICDHQCMLKCTRWFYESPLQIRALKKVVAEAVFEEIVTEVQAIKVRSNRKVAVIGAGPSGLAAAYFLARAGLGVTLFDKSDCPGGIVQSVIPNFRLPRAVIQKDIEFIRRLGVRFVPGRNIQLSMADLRKQGFDYIYVAIGAQQSRRLDLGAEQNVYEALEFLANFNQGHPPELGRRVAVIGGGNSAMDSARAAIRVKGVEKVYIIYRRSQVELPADREEFENALKDGIEFRELLLPVAFVDKSRLKCQKMRLGEPDQSDRRRPVPVSDAYEWITADAVIEAIGEQTDLALLNANGIVVNKDGFPEVNPKTLETNLTNVFIGGDAYRGPSTVVEAMADGRRVADEILARELLSSIPPNTLKHSLSATEITQIIDRKGQIMPEKIQADNTDWAASEAKRCLECQLVCNRCIEVCPNRANVAVELNLKNTKDYYQIVHLDGFCNECGNCATFCPYDEGAPYRSKLTLYWSSEDFENSRNDGWRVLGEEKGLSCQIRLNGEIGFLRFTKEGDYTMKETIKDREVDLVARTIWQMYQKYNYLIREI
jgi:putative selenate reductase